MNVNYLWLNLCSFLVTFVSKMAQILRQRRMVLIIESAEGMSIGEDLEMPYVCLFIFPGQELATWLCLAARKMGNALLPFDDFMFWKGEHIFCWWIIH